METRELLIELTLFQLNTACDSSGKPYAHDIHSCYNSIIENSTALTILRRLLLRQIKI